MGIAETGPVAAIVLIVLRPPGTRASRPQHPSTAPPNPHLHQTQLIRPISPIHQHPAPQFTPRSRTAHADGERTWTSVLRAPPQPTPQPNPTHSSHSSHSSHTPTPHPPNHTPIPHSPRSCRTDVDVRPTRPPSTAPTVAGCGHAPFGPPTPGFAQLFACGLSSAPFASGEVSDGLRARRKPLLAARLVGSLALRFAIRQFAAS